MRRLFGVVFLTLCCFNTACNDAPKADFVSGEANIHFYQIDKGVPAPAAEKVLRCVLSSVPQLRTLRVRQEKEAGSAVNLNISLQSAPDRQARSEPERSYYFVYVNTKGKDKLITTHTFIVKQDFSRVAAFDRNGDDVISISEWLKQQNLN